MLTVSKNSASVANGAQATISVQATRQGRISMISLGAANQGYSIVSLSVGTKVIVPNGNGNPIPVAAIDQNSTGGAHFPITDPSFTLNTGEVVTAVVQNDSGAALIIGLGVVQP